MGSHKAIQILGYHGQEWLYKGGKLLGSGEGPSVEVIWGRAGGHEQILLKDELSKLARERMWIEKE